MAKKIIILSKFKDRTIKFVQLDYQGEISDKQLKVKGINKHIMELSRSGRKERGQKYENRITPKLPKC